MPSDIPPSDMLPTIRALLGFQTALRKLGGSEEFTLVLDRKTFALVLSEVSKIILPSQVMGIGSLVTSFEVFGIRIQDEGTQDEEGEDT